MVLKRNSIETLNVFLKQKKKNGTRAYMETHPNASTAVATNRMSELLRKPEAQIYLQEHVNKATQRIVGLVDSEKEEIALRASQDIIDRNRGKAIQQIQQTTTGITLNLDLSGSTVTINP